MDCADRNFAKQRNRLALSELARGIPDWPGLRFVRVSKSRFEGRSSELEIKANECQCERRWRGAESRACFTRWRAVPAMDRKTIPAAIRAWWRREGNGGK